LERRIVIEVGMSDGFDTARLLERFKLPVYGFEPVPKMYKHTTARFEKNSNVHIMEAAVDVNDGFADFHLSNPNGVFTDGTNRKIHPYGCSSLYEFADDVHEKWKGRPDFNIVETVQVKTICLETFLDEHNFDGAIAYLHCDAQGNDVNVLKSLGKYISCVEEGRIEVAQRTQLYKNTNNNTKTATEFLSNNNFSFKIESKDGHETDIVFKKI